MTTPTPTPITILTGFLGAGKTTLLNRILRGDHGLRVAVLVNDFGAINIDAELVVDVAEETISLTNGCICCSIRDDLLVTVLQLLSRPAPPEYILIEASGVSDPVGVATTFLLPQLKPLVQLDTIITLVDAGQARDQPDYADLIEDQIAAADIVVINKIDLASDNLRAGLHAWVRTLVPQARVLEATNAEVPLELLLGAGGTLARALEPRDERQHSAAFETWSYQSDRPFSHTAARAAFAALPVAVFRAKGVLALAESPDRRVIFQLVGKRFTLQRGEPWGQLPPRSQLVLLGPPGSLDAAALQALLDGALD